MLLISLILGIWSLVVISQVYAKLHKITRTNAIIAMLIPVIVACILMVILGIIFAGLIGSSSF